MKQIQRRMITLIHILADAAVGFYYLPLLWGILNIALDPALLVFIDIIIGALIFWLLSLSLVNGTEKLIQRIEKELTRRSSVCLFFGTLLTIIGLVLAVLISIPLQRARIPVINNIPSILLMIAFSYLGFRVDTTRLDDWRKVFTYAKGSKTDGGSMIERQDDNYHHYKILDTNVLIDGRIYNLVKTDFLEGTLLVPNFVLYGLRYIANSSESIRRVRGYRGLDILNKLRKEKIVPIEIYDEDFEDIPEVDSKLVALAKEVNGIIVTNDYNLNKVIQFQDVQVLNTNSPTKPLRPRVTPGETMTVAVVKKGTERQQGIAYLDDGTVVVVEDDCYFMDKQIEVEATSALQTDVGRMIFARPLHSQRGIDECTDAEHKENRDNKDKKK